MNWPPPTGPSTEMPFNKSTASKVIIIDDIVSKYHYTMLYIWFLGNMRWGQRYERYGKK